MIDDTKTERVFSWSAAVFSLVLLSLAILSVPFNALANGQPIVNTEDLRQGWDSSDPALLQKRQQEGLDPLQDCGLSCNYDRATENISLTARYATRRLAGLKAMADDDARAKALGEFCMVGEDAGACYSRFEVTELARLSKMRAQVLKNTATLSQIEITPEKALANGALRRPVVFDGRQTPKAGGRPESAPNQAPQVTSVLRMKDIEEFYGRAGNEKLLAITSEAYVKDAANRLKELEPKKEDFVKFTRVLRYPGYPDGGVIQVPVTDEKGEPVFDEAAFKRAKAAFDGRYTKDVRADLVDKRKVAERPVRGNGKKALAVILKTDATDSFGEARLDLVDTANAQLKRENLIAGPAAKARALAAEKDANAPVVGADGNPTGQKSTLSATPDSPAAALGGTKEVDAYRKRSAAKGASAKAIDPLNEQVAKVESRRDPVSTHVILLPSTFNVEFKDLNGGQDFQVEEVVQPKQ